MRKILVFDSIHYVIKADKFLQKMGYKYEMITTPREVSSNCGMSIEPDKTHFEQIFDYLITQSFNLKIIEINHG